MPEIQLFMNYDTIHKSIKYSQDSKILKGITKK